MAVDCSACHPARVSLARHCPALGRAVGSGLLYWALFIMLYLAVIRFCSVPAVLIILGTGFHHKIVLSLSLLLLLTDFHDVLHRHGLKGIVSCCFHRFLGWEISLVRFANVEYYSLGEAHFHRLRWSFEWFSFHCGGTTFCSDQPEHERRVGHGTTAPTTTAPTT